MENTETKVYWIIQLTCLKLNKNFFMLKKIKTFIIKDEKPAARKLQKMSGSFPEFYKPATRNIIIKKFYTIK
jgi:hypothetical protein